MGSPDACSLVLDVIRLDTTSFSVQGSYDPADFEEAPFRITRGYSKDQCPDLKQCETLKKQAFADESRWIEVGSVVQEGKKAASYRIQGFEDELYGTTYRFVVVESSALDQRKAKRLEKLVAEEGQAIEKEVAQQERLSYHCEADAEVALEDWRRRHSRWGFHHITGQVVQERTVKRRVGRPRTRSRLRERRGGSVG